MSITKTLVGVIILGLLILAFVAIAIPNMHSVRSSDTMAQRQSPWDSLGPADTSVPDIVFGEEEARQSRILAGASFHAPRTMIENQEYHVTALLRTMLLNETEGAFRERLLADLDQGSVEIVDYEDVTIEFFAAGSVMQAKLEGKGFEISEPEFPIQALSLEAEEAGAIWSWKVKPQNTGRAALVLRIARFDRIDGRSVPVVVSTMKKVINVRAARNVRYVSEISESRSALDVSNNSVASYPLSGSCEWSGLGSNNRNRFALVLGNQNYLGPTKPLERTKDDARTVAAALEGRGFAVLKCEDLKYDQLDEALDRFSPVAANALKLNPTSGDTSNSERSAVAFYYSGHGFASQKTGSAYILPVDVSNRTTDGDYATAGSVSLEEVTVALAELGASNLLIFFDACRDQLDVSTAGTKGLNRVLWSAQPNQYTAYANRWGETTPDSGLYSAALSAAIRTEGATMLSVLNQVQDDVALKTGGAQFPEYIDNAIGDLTF